MSNGLMAICYVPEEYWKLLLVVLVLLKHSLFFNTEYNTDIKHSGNLMEYQYTYCKPSGNQMCKCTIYTFEVELYIRSIIIYTVD